MAFFHPNPMDQSSWLYQTAHFSTWYRCIGIDIPGYGRSPKALPGLTMSDIAEAGWEAIDEAFSGEPAVLVGCSTGSTIVGYMHNQRPERTQALIVCGAAYRDRAKKGLALQRIKAYRERGLAFRWDYAFEDLSPAFRATPMAHYFAGLFTERNAHADLDSIVYQFEALGQVEPEGHYAAIKCPMLILTGSEDLAHPLAFDLQARVAGSELRVLHGAGHAPHMEQPWLFDRYMIEFLMKHHLFPGEG